MNKKTKQKLKCAAALGLFLLTSPPKSHGYWDDNFSRQWTAVQQCTGLTFNKHPNIKWQAAIPCPSSGRACLKSQGYMPCPWDTRLQCGIAGLLQGNTILLPAGGGEAFKHESVHWLMGKRLGDVDRNHTHPWMWNCQ